VKGIEENVTEGVKEEAKNSNNQECVIADENEDRMETMMKENMFEEFEDMKDKMNEHVEKEVTVVITESLVEDVPEVDRAKVNMEDSSARSDIEIMTDVNDNDISHAFQVSFRE
jgi:hypothetical protein